MRIFDSKPALRLIAPLAFVLVVAGTGLIAATASADNKLPARTPQELLVDLQQAKTDGLSGTVVERADLGIPAIPGTNGQNDPELTSLVSGTHTLRVRYSAPDKARLAVLGTLQRVRHHQERHRRLDLGQQGQRCDPSHPDGRAGGAA